MSGLRWTPKELERLTELYKKTAYPGAHMYHVAGLVWEAHALPEYRTVEAINGKLKAMLKAGELPAPEGKVVAEGIENFKQVTAIESLREELRDLRKALRVATSEAVVMQDVVNALHNLVPAWDPPPAVPKAPKAKPDTAVESAILALGDWHFGEKVSAEGMRGWNEYSSHIAACRARTVVDRVLKIKRRLESGGGYSFEELVVPVGGDMVPGLMHDGERHSDYTIFRTTLGCAWVLAQVLRELAAHFPHVHVVCIVGNHGRLAKRKQYKDPDRSFDWLAYQIVSIALQNCTNITMFAPLSHSAMFRVRGVRFYMTHGDEFKAQFSMPYYSIDRKQGRMLALESTRGNAFDHSLIFHWHDEARTPLPGAGKNFVMPSLKGGDEYVLESKGNVPTPGQWFCGVHAKHGVTHTWLIEAEPRAAEPYVYTPWRTTTAVPQAEAGTPLVYEVP